MSEHGENVEQTDQQPVVSEENKEEKVEKQEEEQQLQNTTQEQQQNNDPPQIQTEAVEVVQQPPPQNQDVIGEGEVHKDPEEAPKEVEEEVEEDIPPEELEVLIKQAVDQGQSAESVPTKRKVKKQSSVSKEQQEQNQEEEVKEQTQLDKKTSIISGQNNIDAIIRWMQETLEKEMNVYEHAYWTQAIDQAAKEFINDRKVYKLFFWVEEDGMKFTFTEPPKLNSESYDSDFECIFHYFNPNLDFVKVDGQLIDISTIENQIQHSSVKPNHTTTLLKLLDDVYNPQIYADQSWPENVKKEFIAQLHRIMATLTELSQQQEGFTKLYIPKEDLTNPVIASQDKDLISRLEPTLIQWYRQIKDIVNNQDGQSDNEYAGPLEEISFWSKRKENLAQLYSQLENPDLQKIIKILQLVASSYVESFQDTTKNINTGTAEAENNLAYLNSLYEPCKLLERSSPKDIPPILFGLLNRVRMISEYSQHYNSPERISGLLHKISNEIIKRCKATINISDMLDGDVEKCMQDLQDSIQCGKQWKAIYQKTQEVIKKKKEGKKWEFNMNSIFAQIDAFVQRCTELTEICEGQLQFAGKGKDNQIPKFGGSRGPEIETILAEIRESFKKHLDKIRDSEQDKVLDVKASNWHELFNSFKTGLKDLDVMYNNIISFAFEQVSTVQQGVQMLEAFDYLAKRPAIKEAVKKMANAVISLFINELEKAKQEYDTKLKTPNQLNIPLNHGKISGSAIWVRQLIGRIQKMKEWIDKLYFLDDEMKKQAYEKYDGVLQTFRLCITNTKINEWKQENKEIEEANEKGLGLGPKCLDRAVLLRPDENHPDLLQVKKEQLKSKIGYIECNFDRQLEKLIHETITWKKLASLGAVVPNYAEEFVTINKENLRVLKEYVMLVVRDQNKIKDYMDDLEQKLFKGHMDLVDAQIRPGLLKLKWSSKGILEKFVFESRKVCTEMYNKLKMFKQNTERIEQKCQEISQKILVNLDKKKPVEIDKFDRDQKEHREHIHKQLRAGFEDIRRILCETYEPFIAQGKEIQSVWRTYVLQVDKKIEEALKRAVKNSLLDIQKVVGDEDNNQQASPLIKLYVELENNNIVFKPSTETLIQTVRITMTSMAELLRDFKRMEVVMYEERKVRLEEMKILREKEVKANPLAQRKIVDLNMNMEEPAQKENYFESKIASDGDVQKYINKTLQNLQKHCNELDKGTVKDTWNHTQFYWGQPQNKDKFVEQLIKSQDDINNIKNFISKLEEDQSNTQKERTTEKQGCVVLDNTNIKSAIVEILMQFQTSMLSAVHKRGLKSLNDLYDYFSNNELNLRPSPLDLKQLKANMDTLNKCKAEKQKIEESIKPIEDKFKLLEESNVTLKEEDMLRKNQVRIAWAAFQEMLDNIETRNQKVYADLYNETNRNLEEFIKDAGDNKIHFSANAPFQQANYSNEKAFSLLNEYKDLTKQLRKKETQMKFGYDLFNITYVSPPELEQVELEIERLESVWKTKNEWNNQWEETKLIKFKDFDNEVLDDLAEEYYQKLNSYPKEMKKWEIVNSVKQMIESFRQTLPLIKMLKEPYMRQRHWNQLQDKIGTVLDYSSDSFTLQEIFNIDLLKYHDSVRDVCDVAREEFKIETALHVIRAKWELLEVVVDEHKKGMYKVKKSDEVFTTLEDHMAILSSQKTSLYYEAFREEIEGWENILQVVSETLEMLLQVQRQWIYLEAIFNSQQGQDNDQKKQLMGDINQFEKTEKKFQKHMAQLYQDPNAKRQLGKDGLLKDLTEMSKELDKSQKILNQLLDRNRKEFPRFFFLSNDDLFEILGNSKDPSRINKHIKKCFEGIKRLEFQPNQTITGAKGKPVENYDVLSMFSPEGENVKFNPKVPCDYGVEKWLHKVEFAMQESLKKLLFLCHTSMKVKEGWRWVEKWIQQWPGQLLIVASQINWTKDCQDALKQIEEKPEKVRVWKTVKDQKTHFITELTKLIRKPSSEVDRLKIIAMITIEVHAKDIIEALAKSCFSQKAFDWLKQLRFYPKQPGGEQYEVTIYQTNNEYEFKYGFEYQGNNGRLVITALTDRCYMTLTTAMRLNKGGSPQGPAGTGKTESVKDLGKGMGKFVLVFNCSEGLDYKSLGRMFSGLVQTGGWGCFDEFNRIEVEVLSVVAQQMHQIMNAKKRFRDDPDATGFAFDDEVIPLNDSCAIFITMNPGYAGRSELPDNLKSLFRPISMMLPETTVICEIMLQSEGFKNGRILALKMVTLYNLMTQQLSKQDHYDFGLRAIKSVLNCAGQIRREKSTEVTTGKDKERDREAEAEESNQESLILMRAIKDMNLPKFVQDDIYLFNALFNDLFPNMDLQDTTNQQLQETIEAQLRLQNLIAKTEMVNKVIQLYDTKNTRHGNMLVGAALSGKSTCWKILQKTLNFLHGQDAKKYPHVKLEVLNPKSVTLNELYGWVDHNSMEWSDGVLSTMMSRLCKDESLDQRWMILDGPVDTLWIESMNTVLDDNKVLTLLSGDRISLPPQVGLIFEVEDLSVASPATVSRAGMVYIDQNDLGWKPYLESWIGKIKEVPIQEFFFDLVEKWIIKLFKARQQCKDLVKCLDINIIVSLCNLMNAFIHNEGHYISFDLPEKNEIYWALLEKWWCFSLIWSFGATVNEDGRKIIDYFMRDIESMFPHANTVYDYFISNDKNEWQSFEDKINASQWKPQQNMPYHKMQVPTVDSQRNKFLITTLIKSKVNTLVVGNTGTGKTAVINNILQELDDVYTTCTIVFSARTSSSDTQEQIESKLVRRTKTKMIPDGKKMVIFIDDLNMPRKDAYGSQPALELLRQWIDYEGWFDKVQRDLFKYIIDIQLITCMGPPSGGRAHISRRVQSKFNMINFTQPHDNQIKRIFQSILTFKFQEFDEDIKPLSENLAQATINLFKSVQEGFLPTPAKSHYLFNMRDISKVIQGVYMLDRFYCDSKDTVFRLWVHECLRVFHDRLINFDDRAQLKKIVGDQLEQILSTDMRKATNDEEQDTIFIDFLEENSGRNIYVEVAYKDRKDLKNTVEEKLNEYNQKQRTPMPIVLFEEAISYVCKIHRIIKLGKGHGMLVGEGGSGRHSLSKLAAFIANYMLWEIEISKSYGMKQFKEDVKNWCEQAGQKNKPGVFLFSDNQIVNEGFIESINNILTVGEVPNLFSPKEDYAAIRDKIKKEYLKSLGLEKDARVQDEDLIDFFFTRVQTNFHVIICMSKTGDTMRNYCRMYPGLVNNTTIIWYLPWPEEALMEVAGKYLTAVQLLKKVEINLDDRKQVEEAKQEGDQVQQSEENQQKQEEEKKKEEELKKEQEKKNEDKKDGDEEPQMTEEELRHFISVFFSTSHQRVIELAEKMFKDLKRVVYITPTNYIELVKGYVELLKQKQDEFGTEIRKLSVGLRKLDEAAVDSEQLKAQLSVNSYVLSKKSKECEDLMIRIESEQREANEKQKEVEIRQVQVEKEQAEIKIIAADADADLQAALPTLEMAMEGLKNLDKQKLAEIKAYNKPPTGVDTVCYAIMIILGKEPSWASAKKELAQPDFLSRMQNVDKDHISQKTLLRIEKMTSDPNMSSSKIDAISHAGGCLWKWVIAMEQYAKSFKDIEPKRAKVNLLKEKLRKSEEELQQLQDNFKKLQDTIKELYNKLIQAQQDQEQFKEQTKTLSEKQDRAEKLITGLEGTKEGWAVRKQGAEIKYEYLIGDTLMSSAFMSYAGAFPSQYRKAFVRDTCLAQVKAFKIAHSKDYSFADFLVKQIEFLNWNFKGLPDDQFSKENAVLVTKSNRFPLMIDPQMQANIWIKNMERERKQTSGDKKSTLHIIDPQTDGYMKLIEQAISWGEVVIFQNLDEDIDPSLEPILTKSLQKTSVGYQLTLSADKQIKYDPRFRLYMMTKLSNPRYKPEVSTRVTLVNFTVKEEGLEEQLVSEVIKKMEAQLEKSKNELVKKKTDNEQKLKDLDDRILKMLQESNGQLVDDLDLIKALQSAKETEEEVRHQMETSTTQMRKTLAARNNYVSLARTAAKLFFVINEFSQVNTMYQFALDSYINLFGRVIDQYQLKPTAVNDSLSDKLDAISLKHREEVYNYACRGLFECDKLLLSIQMAVRLSTDIDQDEWNFFLRGGDPLADRKSQQPNPTPDWISQSSWDSICDLDKMTNFAGIVGAFTHNSKEWRRWYMSSNPETDALPGEWEGKCNPLSKMIMIKTIRPDRVLFSASIFVNNKIGDKFVQPAPFKFDELFENSSKTTPVIFILSPGTDPLGLLQTFATQKGIQLLPVSLGQGQAKKARDSVTKGAQEGFWLYLANCHLSLSFLKELEKVIETLEINKNQVHENFRLWLSSAPHPKFPISILQKCVKQTSEPPKGVKANMIRVYQTMPANKFSEGREMENMQNKEWYKKLLFSLTWFHAIIIERKRFKNLGWNVVYDFNDADWETADNILKIYVDEQTVPDKSAIQQSDAPLVKSPPWDAVRFLISEVTYGGRVTDENDRRLLNVYATEYFCDKIIQEEKHKLVGDTGDPKYIIPDQISQKELKNIDQKIGSEPNYYAMKISDFPPIEKPDVFGQHINAEISSQIIQSNQLIESILLLSPKTSVGKGEVSKEDVVAKLLHDLYQKVPEQFNMEEIATKFNLAEETNPLKVVLLQEISRYQILLINVRASLINLDKGLQGLLLISEEVEKVMDALYENRVPDAWKFCYMSLKPLQSWIDDLINRVNQLNNWTFKGQPNVFWISGFSFPTGFITALLQQSARKLRVPIDQFGWEFNFLPYDTPVQVPAKEGAYVEGLFIEGAKWDGEKTYIVEADPMKLHYPMPVIWFKPVFFEGRQKQKKGAMNYACPTYYYPYRTGVREKPSWMLTVLLPIKPNPSAIGTSDQDFWVKRGTALLMSLAD